MHGALEGFEREGHIDMGGGWWVLSRVRGTSHHSRRVSLDHRHSFPSTPRAEPAHDGVARGYLSVRDPDRLPQLTFAPPRHKDARQLGRRSHLDGGKIRCLAHPLCAVGPSQDLRDVKAGLELQTCHPDG